MNYRFNAGRLSGKAGFFCIFVGACILLNIAACGKKAPPISPSAAIARPVEGLSASLTRKSIILSWKGTVKRMDGSLVSEVSGFKIHKAGVPLAEDCPGCPIRFTDKFTLGLTGGGRDKSGDNTVRFEDSNLAYGNKYTYAVQAIYDGKREGELSAPVAICWDVPPETPSSVTAQVGDGWIKLSWKAPQKYEDGSPLKEALSYNIYRRTGERPYKRPTAAGPSSNSFIDVHVVNGTSYAYRISAARSVKGTIIEGIQGEEIRAIPEDTGAPSPPAEF